MELLQDGLSGGVCFPVARFQASRNTRRTPGGRS